MRIQFKKRASLLALVLAMLLGDPTAASANEKDFQNFTFNEADIHQPIFVVLLPEVDAGVIRGEAAIYRVFFGDNSTDDSINPSLNLWTDDKGSRQVLR